MNYQACLNINLNTLLKLTAQRIFALLRPCLLIHRDSHPCAFPSQVKLPGVSQLVFNACGPHHRSERN
jgi:hypothetical protein